SCLQELTSAMDETGYSFVQNGNGVRLSVKDIYKWKTLSSFHTSRYLTPAASPSTMGVKKEDPKEIFQDLEGGESSFIFSFVCYEVTLFDTLSLSLLLTIFTLLFFFLSLAILHLFLNSFKEKTEDIWGPLSLLSQMKYVVKATTSVPSTAVELLAILMDTEQKNDWILGHQHSFRMDGIDSTNDYVYERFLPLTGEFPFNLLMMSISSLLTPRELYRQRWYKICKDGSYIIVLYSSNEAKHALQRTSQNSGRNSFAETFTFSHSRSSLTQELQSSNTPLWKDIFALLFPFLSFSNTSTIEADGFEVILLSPVADKRKCLVTSIFGIDLKGMLPSWYCEMVLLARAKAMNGLRSLILSYRGHALIPVLEESTERLDTSFWSSNKEEMIASNLSSTDLAVVLKKRTEWPLVGFKRNKLGGLACTDEAIIQKQKGVILEVLKSGGKAILEGKGLVGLSLPVRIFEPFSMLESVAKTWGFGPIFFSMAAGSDDPVERLKYAICFSISSLHCACFKLKPFNPILGETFQGLWDDGANVYLEHTSHHPPIAHFLVEGPKNIYKFWGHYEFKGLVKGNAGISIQEGPNILEFLDGSQIEWRLPICRLSGLLWGQRIYEWLEKMEFTDSVNQLHCVLQLGTEAKSIIGRGRVPSEVFKGKIYKKDEIICHISGSWLDGIQFNEKRYWSLLDYEPLLLHRAEKHVLPSDCRYREDAVQLSLGNETESQKWKVILEIRQRKDRQNRMEYRKAHGISDPFCT
ncbi:putative Oxysterol-binding protein 9, partial [Cardiosporidium cionae]